MFSRQWQTSQREYGYIVERDVQIPVGDGTILVGDIYRPDAPGQFPVILGAHCYNNELQTAPLRPIGYGNLRGFIEAGDPKFFARRGYVHAVVNVRGTGKSQGEYQLMGPQEVQDICDVIGWLAKQPWSTGKVGMFGVSYFAWLQAQVAAANPKSLACIFAPWGATDFYRDVFYHGGIMGWGFVAHWSRHWDNPRPISWCRQRWGEERFHQAIAEALQDPDVFAIPELREALQNPDVPRHRGVVDLVLNNLDGEFWRERSVNYDQCHVPAYLGGCWGIYGLHLPGGFRSWKHWKGPKKLMIGPPVYLDRPVFQLQYESLRWFDYWLKGIENGIMDEPPVRLFMPPTGEWKAAQDWPLPQTRWTPFYLHAGGLLSERELQPGEGLDSFEESTFVHHELTYLTPPLVENTEICGPIPITLYASCSDPEMLLFVTLIHVDCDGKEQELTRGWLRASQRRLREDSEPWEPIQAHTRREPLEPGKIYELTFTIVPTGRLIQVGERIGIRIKGADNEPAVNRLQNVARRHVWRQSPLCITIHHDEEHPSAVLLPVTRGNIIGTFLSGGRLPELEPGGLPTALIELPKEFK